MSLLSVKNLSVSFQDDSGSVKNAVNDVSFELEKGQVLGIVGESGSGKSVTATTILGLLPFPKALLGNKSSVIFNGTELIGLNEREFRKIRGNKISYIFQEPMSSLNPLHRVGKQVEEVLNLHGNFSEKEARKETLKLFKMTGIQNAKQKLDVFPFELSGGQRQRVMIAMAIANNPDILIADEPTTALDVTVQKQILNLLKNIKKSIGMSIIFISHDLNVIRKIADNVLVMKEGKIVEQGNVQKVFTHPSHPYTKELINAHILLKNKNKLGKKILSVRDVEVTFPLKKNLWGKVTEELQAVNRVSFDLHQGETVGIVGESGSGKTTLASAIVGLTPYKGNIFFNDTKLGMLSDKHRQELCKDIQIVFQDPYNSLNPRMNVEDIVSEGLKIYNPQMSKDECKSKVLDVLSETGLSEDVLLKYPHEFSGGQRQRIAIARALVLEPKLLVLDEPTSALDVTIQAQIIKLLQQIQLKRNLSYIFISHDMNAVRAMSDTIIVMKDGKMVEYGDCYQIFSNPAKEYTRNLISAAMVEI